MKKIVIFGSGAHARVIFSELVNLKKFKILGFVDDFNKKGKLVIKHGNKNYYCIGKISEIIKKKKVACSGIIGIGFNYRRKKVYEKVHEINRNFVWEKVISKNAVIIGDVKIGEGSIVVSGAVINSGTSIGSHCMIYTSSSIDHDNTFENFSSTGPGVVTGGNVVVKEGSHLGIGSVIKHQVTINKNTVIGGNSFVNKDCDKNSLYYGNPATNIKSRNLEDTYL